HLDAAAQARLPLQLGLVAVADRRLVLAHDAHDLLGREVAVHARRAGRHRDARLRAGPPGCARAAPPATATAAAPDAHAGAHAAATEERAGPRPTAARALAAKAGPAAAASVHGARGAEAA